MNHQNLATPGFRPSIALASGLRFPEEALLVGLRPEGQRAPVEGQAHRENIAIASVLEMVLWGRLNSGTRRGYYVDNHTSVSDPYSNRVASLLKPEADIFAWTDIFSAKKFESLAQEALADRGLLEVSAKRGLFGSKTSIQLTAQGADLGRYMREQYRQMLNHELKAPAAESLFISMMTFKYPDKISVFQDMQEPIAQGGVIEAEPSWRELAADEQLLMELFTTLKHGSFQSSADYI